MGIEKIVRVKGRRQKQMPMDERTLELRVTSGKARKKRWKKNEKDERRYLLGEETQHH